MMMDNSQLHIYTGREGDGWYALFALRLVNTVLERQLSDEWERQNFIRQMDLINALHHCEGNRAIALRYIFQPDEDNILASRVEAVLVGKLVETDEQAARKATSAYCRELVALLGGAMPNSIWEVVSDPEAFRSVHLPFGNAPDVYMAEIRRREEDLDLDKAGTHPSLGRRQPEQPPTWEAKEVVYMVKGFKPRLRSLDGLFHFLRLMSQPLVWQISLSPTCLTEQEEKAQLEEVAKCERYLGEGGKNYQRQRAGRVLGELVEQASRLEDAPFLLDICIASPRPLPRSMIERIGVEITAPVSGDDGGAGGYDVVLPGNDKDWKVARNNLWNITFHHWGKSYAPPDLQRLRRMVDATEAAAAFRLPYMPPRGLPGLTSQSARVLPLPREMALLSKKQDEKPLLFLGNNHYMGRLTPVLMHQRDRLQHMYVMGQTGTGKSTFLKNMILSDMQAGHGVMVIDPHGDLFTELLDIVPRARWKDVVVFDPTDTGYPVGLNMLNAKDDTQRHFVVREMKAIMERLLVDQYGSKSNEYTGPVFFQHMQMNMLLAMSNPGDPGTLLEFHQVFQSKDYWKRWLPLKWKDPMLENWVKNTLEKTDYTDIYETASMGGYVGSKFDDFVFDPLLRNIFGQKTSLDLNAVLNERKILLVNLAKGELTEANSRFLGMTLMAKIQAAAMARRAIPVEERRPCYLYVDEFQNLATNNFSVMLSEARKFGLGLILTNQFITQISDKQIVEAIFGNVGTLVCFRAGREDAEILESRFLPHFDAHDLANQPNWNASVRTLHQGQTVAPFTLQTVLPPEPDKINTAVILRELSRKQYGMPKHQVEQIIQRSMESRPPELDKKAPDLLTLVENEDD